MLSKDRLKQTSEEKLTMSVGTKKQFCVPGNCRKFDFISDISDGATLGF